MLELTFWDPVKVSDASALFSDYLDKFPDGDFHAIDELKSKSFLDLDR